MFVCKTDKDMGVRFHVLMAANMKIIAFWDIAPRSLVKTGRHFGDAYCLHHQGDRGATSQKAKTGRIKLSWILGDW
jgi:hypothetical protein